MNAPPRTSFVFHITHFTPPPPYCKPQSALDGDNWYTLGMKQSWLKRKSGFKQKPTTPMRRARLRVKGHSETADLRDQAQGLLRAIAIQRDKKCVLSNYPETGKCGPHKKNGELILQYDHLNSRVHARSFSDSRLGILVCQRHHIFYKRQYPFEYERCAIDAIGKERAKLLYRVREDRTAYKTDLKLEVLALEKELKDILKDTPMSFMDVR